MSGMRGNSGSATILMMLIASVIVTVGLGFNWLVREHIQASEGLKNKAEAIVKARSAFDTIIYLILNGQYSRREIHVVGGTDITTLETLPLNGQAIPFSKDLQVQIQDSNGLVSLTTINTGVMENLIKRATNLDNATGPVNCLLDWIDSDDFIRINGAEAFYYSGQGLPYTSRNFPIQYKDEVGFIKGFEKDLYGKIQPYLTILPSTGFNPNTASDGLLMAYLDINEETLKTLKDFMSVKPLASDVELLALTGRSVGTEEGSHFFPSPFLEITVRAGGARSIYTIKTGLNTTQNPLSPYSVVYWKEE